MRSALRLRYGLGAWALAVVSLLLATILALAATLAHDVLLYDTYQWRLKKYPPQLIELGRKATKQCRLCGSVLLPDDWRSY